jgi:membrane associated rhomboid family serine protease
VFPAPPLPYWPSAATGPVHPVGVASGEWYRLLTSNFVHLPIADGGFVGVVGLLLSLTALWCLGSLLEELLGSGRLVALYVLCGLGGSVAEYVLAPEQESLGAAGAVCGLATAYFVLSRRLRQHRAAGNRLLTVWLIWMLLSAPFSSWQAYLGGLLTGGLLGAVLAFAPRRARGWAQAAGASAVLVLLVLVVAVQTHHLMTLGGRM